MKSGGADFHIYHNDKSKGVAKTSKEESFKENLKYTKELFFDVCSDVREYFKDHEIAGYALLTWDSHGENQTCASYTFLESMHVELVPEYCKQGLENYFENR